jgi:hypothetical protein
MKIDFKENESLSFYSISQKYNLTIREVMEQYAEWRVQNVKD